MAGGKGDSGHKLGEGAVVRKTISPYDITSLDNPGLAITQVQLKGENYEEWARSFRTALHARKKFRFIDGSIKKPDDTSDDIEDWWTINSLLVSWIRNTIEPTLRSTISHVEAAKDLWDDIRERFSMANGPRIQQLRSYLLEKQREEEKVHHFLMGLDRTYSTVRSNILANDPLPSLSKAYSMMEDRSDVMAMAVQSRGRGESKEKGGVCSHCKQPRHDIDNCFAIIGYPEWWGDRPQGTMKGGSRGKNLGQRQSNGRERGGSKLMLSRPTQG
ncbi:hypothetical protein V6Z11_D11G279100 [Gossypium hirsutum]